ncbi:esterase/lipase family protein [Janthinobacterium agaricidamnosum]|uniref:PGAP1-like family protein n=1 Tax=Janthinobacterium agaricidamnosum NBRC 102515 = DSM 9628 TaxID=1349767 RepID=W0V3V5_9BURK|nr:alpha/beta fold hydrolase [Janthinobacterium agaricidamnosum]CDG82028.1 PGAP1-like family protein [Janthinobacterium agaricidamnosum NBRC 102515 = DSM 9628]
MGNLVQRFLERRAGRNAGRHIIARLLKLLLLLQALAVLGLWWLIDGYADLARTELALLLALLAVLGLRAVLCGQNFWLSRHFGSAAPPQFRPGPLRWLRLASQEFLANLRMSSRDMAWPRLVPPATRRQGGLPLLPVLLVHGYVCNHGCWNRFSARLARAGIEHDAVDLEPPGADIDDFVPLLHDAVQRLCARSGSARVIIVAHSMGGLVARAYLRRHGEARIARVITLGTPHHGTALAGFGLGRNARQMSRKQHQPSPWLQQLAAAETPRRRALFTSIFSHHDNIVAPQTSACFEDAKNIAFGAIGHVTLACHPIILQCVIDEISSVSIAAAYTDFTASHSANLPCRF